MANTAAPAHYDYVVVGCGLAGTLLSWGAVRRGKSVLVYEGWNGSGGELPASRVAPGIINPLAGKRLHPAWRVGEFLPCALSAYEELSRGMGVKVFSATPIIRILQNTFEAEMLTLRESQPDARCYVGARRAAGIATGLIHDPLGSFTATGSGWVNLTALLEGWQKALAERGALRKEPFPYELLSIKANQVETTEWTAGRIVFCEGWRGRDNPWFGRLPFRAAKGEMLDLEQEGGEAMPTHLEGAILNSGKWLLPLGEGRYRAGATYAWDDLTGQPTEAARTEILQTLNEFVRMKFRVVGQRVGIRPIVRDYRPVLGSHAEFPRLGVFNGLGSKGALTAPWLAERLLDYFEEGRPLDKEYSLARF